MKFQVKIPRTQNISQGKIPAGCLFILILTCFFHSPTFSQEATDASLPEVSDSKKIQNILLMITKQSVLIEKELEHLQTKPLSKAVTKRRDELLNQLDGLNSNFESIATQLQAGDFLLGEGEKSDWIKELEALTLPLLEALSDLTKKPRKIDQLKKRVAALKEKLNKFESGTQNINSLAGQIDPNGDAESVELKKYQANLNALRDKYNPDLVRLKLGEAQRSLEIELQDTESIWDTTTNAIRDFFKHRGLNLLIAFMIFAALWYIFSKFRLLILGERSLINVPSWMKKVLATAYNIVVIIFCVLSSLVALYLLNDWLLLSVVILFLVAVVWASRQFIPKLFQEVRLALNLGTVKENERLIWKGVPWHIQSIGLQAILVNDRLEGSHIQLPVGELVGKHSRPTVENEPWFPTECGDWVFLDDATYGKVEHQTMEQVVLRLKGETLKYFSTPEFLAKTPMNISQGFRYDIDFGLDYKLQSKICDEIPKLFEDGLRQHMQQHFQKESPNFTHLEVSFNNAGSSSLNLKIILHVDGRCAGQYEEIQREVQTTLVRICNENQLTIPFTQLTVNLSDELKNWAGPQNVNPPPPRV